MVMVHAKRLPIASSVCVQKVLNIDQSTTPVSVSMTIKQICVKQRNFD